MHSYSNNLRLDSLTHGRMHTNDIDIRHQALVRFAAGGITELASRRTTDQKRTATEN